MTLAQCIAIHAAAQTDAAALTPLGRAHVAARRLSAALADITPQDRQDILMQIVCSAAPGPQGMGFGLAVSIEPTPDPAA